MSNSKAVLQQMPFCETETSSFYQSFSTLRFFAKLLPLLSAQTNPIKM
jgi:hypothetical protein